MGLCTSATSAVGAVILMTSGSMSSEMTAEKLEYIERLVEISREGARFVGIDHASLDISGHALRATEERLERMKREGQTVCSLEAEVEINAYIQIADEMNRRIADARAKFAEYDAVIKFLADEIARKFGTCLDHKDKYGM